jgi:hypothetical protein
MLFNSERVVSLTVNGRPSKVLKDFLCWDLLTLLRLVSETQPRSVSVSDDYGTRFAAAASINFRNQSFTKQSITK